MAEKNKKQIKAQKSPGGPSIARDRGSHIYKNPKAKRDFDLFFETDKTAGAMPQKTVPKWAAAKTKAEWWVGPVAAVMLIILFAMGYLATNSIGKYTEFREMRAAVSRQTFYSGITINGQDMSGYTLSDALALFAEQEQLMREKYQVTLTLGDRQWVLVAEDMGYQNDYRQIVNSAWAIGRHGSLEDRYMKTVAVSDGRQRDFTITENVDKQVFKKKTDEIAGELTVEPVNAKIKSFNSETKSFLFTEPVDGLVVDKEKLADSVVQAVNSGNHQVKIQQEPVTPKKTSVELNAIYGQVSSATTDASSSTSNRLTNISLACKSFDGYMVKPGETFSFNQVVGQRTSEKGYKSAGAIENGIMTQQIGGGICQVSTTLFNAVVKADLEIAERKPHSRPSSYVDLGKDAAVDWPNQDFKFKNTSSNPVYISAELTSKKRVVISIYGEKLKDGMSIVLESKKTATIEPGDTRYIKDNSLARGEEVLVEGARKGYKAETYKVYLDANGEEIKREFLCNSTYASSGAVIKVGG